MRDETPPFDVTSHCLIRRDGALVRLSMTEWRLLEHLWKHRGKPVASARLWDLIWGRAPSSPLDVNLAVRIYHIREKLATTGWRIVSNLGPPREDKVYCLQPEWAAIEPHLHDPRQRRQS
jgi:hypothetical protein